MAVIGQRTFSGGVEQYMNLAKEDFVRPLAFGTNWNSVKIVALVSANFEIAQTLASCTFTMGVCSNGVPFGGPGGPTNYVGGIWGSALLDTWTYVANAGNPYYSSPYTNGIVKVGVAYAMAGGNSAQTWVPLTPTNSRRAIFACTITKGSPNYTVQASYYQALADFGHTDLLNAADQLTGTSTVLGVNITMGGSYLVGAAESNGPLNYLNIYWNRSFPLEFYGIAVSRMS